MKKKTIALFTVILMCAFCSITAFAADSLPYLVDEADLFTSAEEESLSSKLETVSNEFELDIVVLTITTLGDKTIEDYADDYYDYSGYGKDGALLLIAVDEDERYVSTCGSCIDAIDVSALGDEISGYLDDKNYVSAVNGLVDYVNKAFSFDLGFNLLVSIVIGLIVAYIVVSSMKGKLKSVRMQNQATNYIKANSMNVAVSRDIFLYRVVTSKEKQKDDDNTHTSSSGRTHGGGKI